MEAFVLGSVFFIGSIILAGLYSRKIYENQDINAEKRRSNINENKPSQSNPPYYEKFVSRNNQHDFLDFSGGAMGI